MPFTPLHMGPGICIKAVLQGSFSLMVFGWTQIVMDIQPLIVLITGEGHLHGFSHTYIGATLLAIISALTGKHLSEIGLFILGVNQEKVNINWLVTFISAFIGSYSHVAIDSIMHSDIQPLFPITNSNYLLEIIPVSLLHKICIYSGIIGGIMYFAINWACKNLKITGK